MRRKPEPELMDDPVQAAAYAHADFSEPHGLFIRTFQEVFQAVPITGDVLDLGCGPADISVRFAKAFPECHIYGVDGAPAMLREGRTLIRRAGLERRIELLYGVIPEMDLPQRSYQAIISNSLLHHLHDPVVLWKWIRRYCSAHTLIFIMDLMRPDSIPITVELVNTYCGKEPEILKRDFYKSLCAAFLPEEVNRQLEKAGWRGLTIKQISDRHMIIFG